LSANVWQSWTKEALLWRLQTAAGSGGVLGDLGCHILDMTTAVAGDVRRVRCELRTFPKIAPDGKRVTAWKGKPLDANDTAVIELEFVHGAMGLVHTTRWATGHANSLRLEAHGTEGGLMFDLDRDYAKLDLSLGRDRHKCKWKTLTLKPTPNNWQRFIRAIRTGRPDQPDVIRGAQVQAVLDACERSGKSGRWEDVRVIS
jgi:predicted dehydrogenase